MVQITEFDPPRGRDGEQLTIRGDGFAPDPVSAPGVGNTVQIFGVTAVGPLQQTEEEIVVLAPNPMAGFDVFLDVVVQRNDTNEGDAQPWWVKPSLSYMQTVDLPGQVPGPIEATDLDREIEDTPLAKDYERASVLCNWLSREVLTVVGQLLTHDGTGIAALPPGVDGLILTAAPGEPLGLAWQARDPGRLTFPWGREIPFNIQTLQPMAANGDSTNTSTVDGEHGLPFDCDLVDFCVLVQEGSPGDVLSQVTITIDGVLAFDSGAISLSPGDVYNPGIGGSLFQGERLVVNVQKTGNNGLMRLQAILVVQEKERTVVDAVQVTDSVVADLVGVLKSSAPSDFSWVTDAVVVSNGP